MRMNERGFTLIEMMIVVAVIGILSAVAIPSFRSYIYRSQVTEAVTFLGEIRQRQESYRAEFGQYCSVSGPAGGGMGAWAPAAAGGAWTGAPGDWGQLGANPDGAVRFQYRTVAGPPTTQPAGVPGYNGSDFWFVAQAQADLDADGDVMIIEAYSAGRQLFFADGSMNHLSSGYE